jgi:hypothetical protein
MNKDSGLRFYGTLGAAFLLHHPSRYSARIGHALGAVELRTGAPYVLVRLDGLEAGANVRDVAWQVVQESFDIRAATHRDALATRRSEQEYLLWKRDKNECELTIVDTVESRWDMSATLTVGDGTKEISEPQPVAYHPALRFYRFSQLSDDLFDAYRNAYLALECLISAESAIRPGESETAWLERVLASHFADAVPRERSISDWVKSIYKGGRLPIFHAKVGRGFLLPQGPGRSEISTLHQSLQHLLASVLRFKLGDQVAGGWGAMSQELIDRKTLVCCQANEISFQSPDATERVTASMVPVEEPRRFGNIWAYVAVAAPSSLDNIHRISFFENSNETIWMELHEPVSLQGITNLRVELNFLDSNARAPSPLHAR